MWSLVAVVVGMLVVMQVSIVELNRTMLITPNQSEVSISLMWIWNEGGIETALHTSLIEKERRFAKLVILLIS
jgi:hypothetical protein